MTSLEVGLFITLVIVTSMVCESNAQCACGLGRRRSKIIGGSTTSTNEYPWMAGLVESSVTANSPRKEPFCGGSLVNANHVVTAAHCLIGETAQSIKVVLGEQNWRRNGETNTLVISVSQLFRQPGFNVVTLNKDVAVVRLASSVNFASNPHISPICLIASSVRSGRWLTTAGWGVKSTSNNASPGNLKAARIKMIPRRQCQSSLGTSLTTNMVCAGINGGGVGTCYGDSGGPLMQKSRGTFELYGVTSWGIGCAERNMPGVYAKIRPAKSWILSVIGSECARAG